MDVVCVDENNILMLSEQLVFATNKITQSVKG